MLRRFVRFKFTESNLEPYIKMLEKDGFTNDQAKGLVLLVNEAITESMVSAIQSMVPKTEQQQEEEEMNKQLQLLTDEINTLEKKDFATIKGELARITEMVNTIKGNMRDDINRIHGGIRLDANLEKARMKEESDDLIKQLDLAEAKIEKEIGKLSEKVDRIRTSTKRSLRTILLVIVSGFIGYKTMMVWAPQL